MTGEIGIHKDLAEMLLLPHLPPPQPKVKIDKANLAFQVAIIHKMSIDDIRERKDAKYLKEQHFIDVGEESRDRKQMQMIATSKIKYWESALLAAKKAAREACEQDLENLKYLKFLAELEEIVI